MSAETAERLAYRFEWHDDWGVGSHVHEYGADAYSQEPETCEYVLLYVTQPCGHEEVVDSLGCIDDGAEHDYRGFIERQMLAEYVAEH